MRRLKCSIFLTLLIVLIPNTASAAQYYYHAELDSAQLNMHLMNYGSNGLTEFSQDLRIGDNGYLRVRIDDIANTITLGAFFDDPGTLRQNIDPHRDPEELPGFAGTEAYFYLRKELVPETFSIDPETGAFTLSQNPGRAFLFFRRSPYRLPLKDLLSPLQTNPDNPLFLSGIFSAVGTTGDYTVEYTLSAQLRYHCDTEVPEPASMLLLASGVLPLVRRRRARQAGN